ncbi:MAG: TIM barrel protein [Candidatus Aenigmarchaeota archaeon]|nr:TIM barrel protein [Candidatus Aenigmarchaeota archaeon]
MKELLFGTAGIPISTAERNTLNGISRVKEMGLGAMELEFVHSVNISEELAPSVKEAAEKNDVILTCHGQYYMNLNSKEVKKQEATIERILKAARIANMCGAWSLCFHAAFYMGMEKEAVYNTVKEALKEVSKTLRDEGNKIWIRPETTGKGTQFGDLDELLRLSEEVEGVMPCVDFSHFHARTNGKYNTYDEFSQIMSSIEKRLGKKALSEMHMHLAGIAYGEKGEKHHLNLKESDLKYRELAKAMKDFGVKGVLISESPNIEEDALLMKKVYGTNF